MKPFFRRGLLSTSIAVISFFLSGPVLAQLQTSASSGIEGGGGGFTPQPGSIVLYDQSGGAGVVAFTSENFDAPADDFDSQAADDFIVTDASGWSVTQVYVLGIDSAASSANVWFYNDAGGVPGAAACTYTGIPVANDGLGNLTVTLPANCELAGSTTYWLSVQTISGGGQWFWLEHSAVGAAAQWQNPGDGFGRGCTTWQPRLSCLGIDEGFPDQAFIIAGTTPGHATFLVSKDFNDNNPAEVEVTLSCNTGLPLEQTTTISEGDPVNFVVGDFEPGTMDCEATEVVPDGYTASYNDGSVSPDNCSWEDVVGGGFSCEITNVLDQVEIEVTKIWIDENPQFNPANIAEANWFCSNVSSGQSSGFLRFSGNPDSESFFVFPDWDGGTDCEVTEVDTLEGGVEVDDSDCQSIVVFPGTGGSCEIVNTRLFEGIPTLSRHGLALLALLMLGIGFVGFRRFV